jgi:FkbM family methyltransferase
VFNMPGQPWTPTFTLGERLKYALIPARFDMWRVVRKRLRRGEPELRFLPQLVARDKIALDIGANRGVYSYVLSTLCERVVAFEPNPKMFAILKRGLRPNATAHQVALSNLSGEAELSFPLVPGKHDKFSNQRASLLAPDGAAERRVVRVQTRTLDSYDLCNVGFIKIDVEGFEQSVLDGARETLARERPVLLVEMAEVHTHAPIERSIEAVQARGYEVFYLRDGTLRSVTEFDPEQNRRAAGTVDFVYNFIAKAK